MPRKSVKEERMRQIIDVSKKLFIETGYSNTQIDDIAREAGIAHGLIYHYFKSKEEILQNIAANMAKLLVVDMLRIINRDSDIKNKIDMLFEYLVKFYYDNSKIADVYHSKGNEKLHTMVSEEVINLLAPSYIDMLEKAALRGESDCQPEIAARFCLYGVMGINFDLKTDVEYVKTLIYRVLNI